MGKVYSIFCRKGGVGKSTLSTNLVSFLSRYVKKNDGSNCKCLLIDLDNQGNACQLLGMDTESLPERETISKALLDDDFEIENLIVKAGTFDVIPANSKLIKADRALVDVKDVAKLYNKIIKLKNEYDYIIIDMPPASSATAENGIVASDGIIVPVQAEMLSFEGLGEVLSFLDETNNKVRVLGLPEKKILGVVYNQVSKTRGIDEGYVKKGREKIEKSGMYCFNTILHDLSMIPRSQDNKKTIFEFEPKGKSAKEFFAFGEEFIKLIETED